MGMECLSTLGGGWGKKLKTEGLGVPLHDIDEVHVLNSRSIRFYHAHVTPAADIPRPTVRRLSLYLRELEAIAAVGTTKTSSLVIAQALGVTDVQVRRDLGCLGQTGKPGVGYMIGPLTHRIREALSLNRSWKAIIVGAGRIGRALMAYPSFAGQGIQIVAAVDCDPSVVGTTVAGTTIDHMDSLASLVSKYSIDLAVLAVPQSVAQVLAELMVKSGIDGILNFTPATLHVPIPVERIDLSRSLEQLAFEVAAFRSQES